MSMSAVAADHGSDETDRGSDEPLEPADGETAEPPARPAAAPKAARPPAPTGQATELFGELSTTLAADAEADKRYRHVDAAVVEAQLHPKVPVARKLLWTALCFGVLLAVPYSHPALSGLRLFGAPPVEAAPDEVKPTAGGPLPSASVGEAQIPGETQDQQARAKELTDEAVDSRGPLAAARAKVKLPPAVKEKKPPRSIEDPSGTALDKFFKKLIKVESKEPGAIARILYYGDSIVASDFVTGKLRRDLHDRFGDAGHGYAIIANAWPGWFHIDVSRQATSGWGVSTCVGPYAEDGLYGLGCASFTSRHKGIFSQIGTATLERWGRNVSSFEIEYLRQPGGGALDLIVDDQHHSTLETEGPEKVVAYHRLEVPDGPHTLTIKSIDERPVRAFGIRLERAGPGVTLSALGITGARARFLDKQDDEHWAQVLRAAKPDLVVLAFGSNEVVDGTQYPMKDFRATQTAVMKQIKAAVPEASLLLSGPPDMASPKPGQVSRPAVFFMVKNQKELAAQEGWAYWDQYRAMGGDGSMRSWMNAGLGSDDMFHPTGRGGNVLGRWLYFALMEAYEQYKAAQR